MDVIPAIDLRAGRCVRLVQGDYNRETIFSDDPAAMAQRWQAAGATQLHLVDLDAAKSGQPVNIDAVRSILSAVSIPCQLGGGVRDDASAHAWLDAGIDRVIVGTAALTNPDWFRRLATRHPHRVALGLDARDGKVATAGWLETSNVDALTLAAQYDDLPLAAIIYTDIARDGMLEGPNIPATANLAQKLKAPIIASGGVGTLEHLRQLAAHPSIAACIVGRALYDQRFTLEDAIKATLD